MCPLLMGFVMKKFLVHWLGWFSYVQDLEIAVSILSEQNESQAARINNLYAGDAVRECKLLELRAELERIRQENNILKTAVSTLMVDGAPN